MQPVIRKTSGHINVTFSQPIQEELPKYERYARFDQEQHTPLKRVMKKLDSLIGLEHIKTFVYEIYAWLYIAKCRKEIGLKANQQTLHMLFKGNPGTGKTTVARILGQLFREMGIIKQGNLIEVERADLVGEYIGHTAQKTRELVRKSLGSVLFIDEAYSLARGGEKDFGKEAIDTLVKSMEDYNNEFVLILAGYPQEMESFMATNPGLPSRFPIQMDFENYNVQELVQIAKMMVSERDYQLSSQAEQTLKFNLHQKIHEEPNNFSNARFVRNFIEKAIREQAVRLLHEPEHTKSDLMTLSTLDFMKTQ